MNVADRTGVERAVGELADELGGLDGVVTAAGIDRPGGFGEIPAEAWELVIGVNLLGTVSTVRAALPHLEAVHGRAVIFDPGFQGGVDRFQANQARRAAAGERGDGS